MSPEKTKKRVLTGGGPMIHPEGSHPRPGIEKVNSIMLESCQSVEGESKVHRHAVPVSLGVVPRSILLPGIGMFLFYMGHDALQEEVFRFDGFQFGWFMTLAEVSIMIVGAILTEGVGLRRPPGGTRTVWITAAIGCCVAGSHGFGNTALNYSTYPMKVAFKSCKLVPTMAMGLLVTGKRYSWGEYMAAVVMCIGLFSLTVADSMYKKDDSGKLHYMGPLLLTLGNMFDSVVPNLQEKLLQRVKVRPVDMIFLSNMFVFIIIFCYTQVSGELAIALQFCRNNPTVMAVLVAQSACAYCGLRCYLTVIRSHGGVAGVLLANARKICTILLSFVLFAKPFNKIHCVSIFLIFLGVYFGVVLKRSGDKQTKMKTPKQDHQHII